MKKQINLYQPSCYPKREKVTFKQFLLLAGLSALLLLVSQLYLGNQLSNAEQRVAQHKASLKLKEDDLLLLVAKLQKKRAPESKIREQLALQTEVETKQRLLQSLSGIELGITVSFSELMRGLSLARMGSISIDSFSIVEGRLNISGQAKESDSVPLWLSKVQATKELTGVAFETLKISDSGEGFSFQLSNSFASKTAKESAQ